MTICVQIKMSEVFNDSHKESLPYKSIPLEQGGIANIKELYLPNGLSDFAKMAERNKFDVVEIEEKNKSNHSFHEELGEDGQYYPATKIFNKYELEVTYVNSNIFSFFSKTRIERISLCLHADEDTIMPHVQKTGNVSNCTIIQKQKVYVYFLHVSCVIYKKHMGRSCDYCQGKVFLTGYPHPYAQYVTVKSPKKLTSQELEEKVLCDIKQGISHVTQLQIINHSNTSDIITI